MFRLLIILSLVSSCLGPGSVEEMIGPDENMNGIRDDIDEYIGTKSRSLDEKKAFEQYAIYLTKTFKTFTTKKSSINNSFLISKAGDCVDNVFLGKNKKYGSKLINSEARKMEKLMDVIHSSVFDSRSRLGAYTKSNTNFSGQVTTGYKKAKDACEFKLEGDYR
jgi:hypothetical protein